MPLPDRFWGKVEKGPGCWQWLGGVNQWGYAVFYVAHAKPRGAHRLAYEEVVGPIPTGLQLDHLCRNRSCVNPAHLEPVTQRENLVRGTGWPGMNARKTHCINGHPFDELNTYPYRGRRFCRACDRARKRASA